MLYLRRAGAIGIFHEPAGGRNRPATVCATERLLTRAPSDSFIVALHDTLPVALVAFLHAVNALANGVAGLFGTDAESAVLAVHVVVNGIAQNRETIGDAGIAFEAGNTADLKDKLAQLLTDPARIMAFGGKAQQRINEVYNWERVVDQLELVYEDL